MTSFFGSLREEWFSNIRGDTLSGLVVALALIPEAIAFSIIASGIKASATTKPDNVSPRILENHSSRKLPKKDVISKLYRVRGKKNNHL